MSTTTTTTPPTVRVDPIPGEVLRYHVQSWSNPNAPHMVDLSLYGGNGECSCRDFTTRRRPAILAGAVLFTRKTSCRHVIAARKYFTQETLGEMARRLHPSP